MARDRRLENPPALGVEHRVNAGNGSGRHVRGLSFSDTPDQALSLRSWPQGQSRGLGATALATPKPRRRVRAQAAIEVHDLVSARDATGFSVRT